MPQVIGPGFNHAFARFVRMATCSSTFVDIAAPLTVMSLLFRPYLARVDVVMHEPRVCAHDLRSGACDGCLCHGAWVSRASVSGLGVYDVTRDAVTGSSIDVSSYVHRHHLGACVIAPSCPPI